MSGAFHLLTLYGNDDSGNDYKVRLLLAHLDIAWRRIDIRQTRGDTRSPAFLAVNPMGKIPTLRFDDGRMLSESGAILHFLAQGTRYWPDQAWQQAQVLRWMFFEQYSHEPRIAVNRYYLRFLDDRGGLESRIEDNLREGARALAVMDQQLEHEPYIAGAGYTIADIALYAYTHVAHEGGFDLAPYPALRAWLERVASQPGHVAMG